MRTVDITIEEASFAELDSVSRAVGLTPAEFARRVTAAAVRRYKARDAAKRDEIGYATLPVREDEFALHPDDLNRLEDQAW